MVKKLYADMFFHLVDSEDDIDRTFLEFEAFHDSCLPESEEPYKRLYHKIFKSMWFKILSPIIFTFAKFQAMKYTNQDYLQKLVDKHIEDD